ncbi:DNA translocase FtsK 4TM domain-containing protein [Patescibacteria group bacterium]
MAKRRRRKYTYKRKKKVEPKKFLGIFKEGETPPENVMIKLKSDTARELVAVFLMVVSGITLLSLFGIAGRLGDVWGEFLRFIFGIIAFPIPVILTIIGILLFYPNKYQFKFSMGLGMILGVAVLCGFFHLFVLDHSLKAAQDGIAGGYIGYAINLILGNLIGFVASLIILIGLFLTSVLLTFDTSLAKIKEKIQSQDLFSKEKVQKVGGLKVNQRESDKKPISFLKNKLKKDDKPKEKEEEQPKEFKPLFAGDDNGSDYQKPSLELLSYSDSKADSGDVKKDARIIQETLENFNIKVSMEDVNVGPTVTQYTLRPEEGVKLNKITALGNDLALALAAHPIRIEAPIPGKSLVGIEVPNKKPAIVTLRSMLESEKFKNTEGDLKFTLGENVYGETAILDLTKMPHLLIAGATGSGKSVSIHTLLTGLLYQYSPHDLRLILVDPKRVELNSYADIPHLITPVITDVKKTVNALNWLTSEMERRYQLFSDAKKRDIDSYNKMIGKNKKLPYIVLVIDELADLMAQAGREIEGGIVRLAQMARATGIHLVVATQRPSVNVITGLIKANITSRIAFMVASQVDSRTILDMAGAEKLLGSGDMLYLGSDLAKPQRVQGSFVSEVEVKKVVNFLKKGNKPEYEEEVTEKPARDVEFAVGESDDELLDAAIEVITKAGKGSASLLQRRLRVGYARAARLLDLLEEKGIVGPQDGSKPREVLKK